MKFQLVSNLFVTTVVLSSVISLPLTAKALPTVGGSSTTPATSNTSSTNSSSGNTKFECVQSGTGYATIAVTSTGKKTRPLINWSSQAFAQSGFTPEVRCREVSSRLTAAVGKNGGKLSGLLLTTGNLNRENVICYVSNMVSGCNKNNHLMNIAPGYNKPEDALADLLQAITTPFVTGATMQNSERRSYAEFGGAVQQVVNETEMMGSTENPPSSEPMAEPANSSGGDEGPI
ncbi:COP23 domain-containing protein [Pantanalinema rosaneae CENA516]|uniref:COP23 domain-containing protein n=1 Tax=Pantanalinema rosaneae TaxID=1620701 RepID=UPI003D6E5905